MEEKLFTIADMRNAFIAGEAFELDSYNLEMDEVSELTEPDFGEWMEKSYNVKID
jgi:hypothetical protein